MRIFKNSINVKWLLITIGIVAMLGVSYAAVNPIISNTHSYLDILHLNYLHGDCSNCTNTNVSTAIGIAPNSSLPISAANTTITNTFLAEQRGTIWDSSNYVRATAAATDNPTSGVGIEMRWTTNQNWGSISSYNRTAGTDTPLALIADAFYMITPETAGSSYSALCINAADNGHIYYNSGVQTCTVSDMRLKENVSIISASTTIKDNFAKIEIIKYRETNDPAKKWRYGINSTKLGQDFPMLVAKNETGYITGVHYELLSVLNTLIIQDQANQLYDQQLQLNIFGSKITKICSNQPALCS